MHTKKSHVGLLSFPGRIRSAGNEATKYVGKEDKEFQLRATSRTERAFECKSRTTTRDLKGNSIAEVMSSLWEIPNKENFGGTGGCTMTGKVTAGERSLRKLA